MSRSQTRSPLDTVIAEASRMSSPSMRQSSSTVTRSEGTLAQSSTLMTGGNGQPIGTQYPFILGDDVLGDSEAFLVVRGANIEYSF